MCLKFKFCKWSVFLVFLKKSNSLYPIIHIGTEVINSCKDNKLYHKFRSVPSLLASKIILQVTEEDNL
jgi:hypothetical protein